MQHMASTHLVHLPYQVGRELYVLLGIEQVSADCFSGFWLPSHGTLLDWCVIKICQFHNTHGSNLVSRRWQEIFSTFSKLALRIYYWYRSIISQKSVIWLFSRNMSGKFHGMEFQESAQINPLALSIPRCGHYLNEWFGHIHCLVPPYVAIFDVKYINFENVISKSIYTSLVLISTAKWNRSICWSSRGWPDTWWSA